MSGLIAGLWAASGVGVPIRSPRGRGAAYRALWQWPLRSPARLIGCGVALVVVLVGLNALLGLTGIRHPGGLLGTTSATGPVQAKSAAPRAPAAAAPTRLPPVPELTPAVLPLSKAPPAALAVATKWTQAWAKHPPGTTTQTWVNGLKPFTTEEYLGVLDTVDPANVPATKVTGPARAVAVAPSSVRVDVPTDALTLVVLVVDTGSSTGANAGGEWRVAGYDRAEPTTPPGPTQATPQPGR
jgi:hypothetical protein